MAEVGQDSQKADGELEDGSQWVPVGGDCVSDLGLDAVPVAQDGVAEEAQEASAGDVAKEILNEILNEVRTPPESGEEEEDAVEKEDEEAHAKEGGEDLEVKDIELVKNTTKLLEKLEIAEGSEGGGSGSAADDDHSSSMDSTANSGARQGEDTPSDDKGVSGEESLEGATERPKKRIDLQHQFIRGIVKIQQDRDQYEKQYQTKKQEKLKDEDAPLVDSTRSDSRSSGTSSRTHRRYETGKRQHSSMESARGGLQQRREHLNAPPEDAHDQQGTRSKQDIYRPPSLRTTPAKDDRPRSARSEAPPKDIRPRSARSEAPAEGERLCSARSEAPEDVGMKITFDTERQRRSIQLSKPGAGPGEGESNLVVTFDTARKERHIETAGGCGRVQPQLWSERPNNYKYKDGGELPSAFQFKAAALSGNQNGPNPSEEDGVVRARGRFRGSKPLTSTPRQASEKQGFLVLNSRKDRDDDASTPTAGKEKGGSGTFSPAPPARQKGGISTPEIPLKSKWSDIVESESEPSPVFSADAPSNSTTPDVFESNQWKSPAITRRRGGPRKPRQQQKNSSRQQQHDSSPSPQASESQNSGGRRSVWERLGPRPWLDRPANFKSLEYEPGSMASMREMCERDYFCREDSNCENSESAVQAAYRDTKQKRTRMELYVPRRGGS